MVTDRYLNIIQHPTVDEFVSVMKSEGRQIIAIDNIVESVPLSQSELPAKIVMVFGGEGPGISLDMQKAADKVIAIEQFGSTRSINVGVASGIAMYAWMQKNVLNTCNIYKNVIK
jgi:tRNA G18 (ribose-2'-O)-methylase SpoU